MGPDFSRQTTEILAKRAAYQCSNPDCRAITIGPNDVDDKATLVGEAAHIYAARVKGPRYKVEMTDAARGEITNGIWLCRNCHRKVDVDPSAFSAELLFAWRELHEAFVAANLGATSDRLRYDLQAGFLDKFSEYPPIIRRIAIDKPRVWEYRLTSELLRHLNQSQFRRMRDLRDGLYTHSRKRVQSWETHDWVQAQIGALSELFGPLEEILKRLTASWGELGEPGDVDEIHHSCLLLRDAMARIVEYEEEIRFADVPTNFEPVRELLVDRASSQAEKFAEIPEMLDDIVAKVDKGEIGGEGQANTFQKTIAIELPEQWGEKLHKAMIKAQKAEKSGASEVTHQVGEGVRVGLVIFALAAIVFFLVL